MPVFSFEAEAEAFLRLGKTETYWRAREPTFGELISLLHGPCSGVNRVALDPLPVVDGDMVFDLAGWGREAFLQDFVGALPAPDGKSWKQVTVNDGLPASADGNGAPPRKTEEEHEHTKNGAVRRKHKRIRGAASDGAGDAAIPDYVMWDFGLFDGLRNYLDGRSQAHGIPDSTLEAEDGLRRERG
ncbi:MAG: hypothetical protein M3N45_01115 [Actinomycetota bacterium]|nr:hypothetical protein [Actinomycetota bacterium]